MASISCRSSGLVRILPILAANFSSSDDEVEPTDGSESSELHAEVMHESLRESRGERGEWDLLVKWTVWEWRESECGCECEWTLPMLNDQWICD